MTDRDRYRPPSRNLQADIKQILLDRGLRAGDPMPTEGELIDILGVSRGSLREALKGLQAVGIIETRHGLGSFVSPPSFAAMADGLAFHSRLGEMSNDLATAADLVDIREILETTLIKRVAVGASVELISELDSVVTRMTHASSKGINTPEFNDLDLAFHSRLYSELGNALVLELLSAFWSALAIIRPLMPEPFDRPSDAVDKHRAIAAAIRAGDAAAAEQAMKSHFALTRAWIEASARRTA